MLERVVTVVLDVLVSKHLVHLRGDGGGCGRGTWLQRSEAQLTKLGNMNFSIKACSSS